MKAILLAASGSLLWAGANIWTPLGPDGGGANVLTVAKTNELVLEITEQSADGRRFDRRLVLEKKYVGKQEEKNDPKSKYHAMVVLSIAINCSLTQGQAPASTTLVIDLQNVVEYQDDAGNPAKFATDPNRAPSATFINLGVGTVIADIVAVNGKPAKGIYAGRSRGILASATPRDGGAIADLTRTSLREQVFEILTGDGIPIGTIMSVGFNGGPAPPGARRFGAEGTDFIGVTGPMAEKGNWAIAGGTGAFLGARGQLVQRGESLESIPPRQAPMTEDPANRRINGGGTLRFFLHVIPMLVPQIVGTDAGPAVTHSKDFKLVTAANPAAAGEILSLFATGLGPTVPEVDPGQSFPGVDRPFEGHSGLGAVEEAAGG